MKARPVAEMLDQAIRNLITSDPNALLLASDTQYALPGTRLVMGTLVPKCPFCACSAVMATVVDDDPSVLAVLECYRCRASTTFVELFWVGIGKPL